MHTLLRYVTCMTWITVYLYLVSNNSYTCTFIWSSRLCWHEPTIMPRLHLIVTADVWFLGDQTIFTLTVIIIIIIIIIMIITQQSQATWLILIVLCTLFSYATFFVHINRCVYLFTIPHGQWLIFGRPFDLCYTGRFVVVVNNQHGHGWYSTKPHRTTRSITWIIYHGILSAHFAC